MSDNLTELNFGLLNNQISRLMTNAETLKHSAQQYEEQELLTTALEELSTALEELQVTEEELRAQHSEILLTRQALEEERQRYIDLFDFAPDSYLVTDLKGIIQQVNRAAAQLLGVRQDYLEGKPLRLYLHSDSQDEFQQQLGIALQPHQTVNQWEAKFQPRHLPLIQAAITMTAIHDFQGKAVGLRWSIRDVTRRKEAEQQLRDLNAHLEQRVRERTAIIEQQAALREEALRREQAARAQAEALSEIGTILNSTLELSKVLELILMNVGRMVPNDSVIMLLVSGDHATPALCQGYERCGETAFLSRLQLPIDTSFPLNEMAETDHSIIIPNLNRPIDWLEMLKPQSPIRSIIGIPIHARGEILGFLSLTSRHPDFYNMTHVELLQAFSTQAAAAIQNANLHQQSKTVAALEERQRLARDLHDAVTQTLFTSSLVAEALVQLGKTKPQDIHTHLDYLVRLNRGALAEMRTLLLELRPAHLTTVNLPTQLYQLTNALRARKEIEVNLVIDDGVPMPPDVQVAFFRIAQEAFNNVSKHSRAANLYVKLISDTEKVVLIIQDNGRGFALDAADSGEDGNSGNGASSGAGSGMGMSTMQERAENVGATFEVKSAPGQHQYHRFMVAKG